MTLPDLKSPVFVHVDLMWCIDDSRNFGHAAERTLKALQSNYDTFIIPTFTLSFYHDNKPFDVLTSPSEVGLFSEYARTRLHRTTHAGFSCVSNKKIKVGQDAFGAGSIFDYIKKQDGTILLLGCGLPQGGTFVHHVEQCFGVDYRYRMVVGGFSFYVRNPALGVRTVLGPVEEYMLKLGTLKREGPLMYGSVRAIFDDVTRLLSYDSHYLVRFER